MIQTIDSRESIIEKENPAVASANIHITSVCNYRCGFCFCQNLVDQTMPFADWQPIFRDLYRRGIRKINFVGGEPFCYPDLHACCEYCKQLGFTVTIVSNGSLITEEKLGMFRHCLDWLGLSIDSPDEKVECLVGRHCGNCNHVAHAKDVARWARRLGIKLKLNITVMRQNFSQNLSELIAEIQPLRVKAFQVTKVAGENEEHFAEYCISDDEYHLFRQNHEHIQLRNGQHITFETDDLMLDSYLMIDPLGRVVRNSDMGQTLTPYGEAAAEGLDRLLNVEAYRQRGGRYNWETGDIQRHCDDWPPSLRFTICGITGCGKKEAITAAIEKTRLRYGLGFSFFPRMAFCESEAKSCFHKSLDTTTAAEKGWLLVQYEEEISNCITHPFLMQDVDYSFPATYGGKIYHDRFIDAKFPFVSRLSSDLSCTYEVICDETLLAGNDEVFYLQIPPNEILQRIREGTNNNYGRYLSIEDISAWEDFEIRQLTQTCLRLRIPFHIIKGLEDASDIITDAVCKYLGRQNWPQYIARHPDDNGSQRGDIQ